MSIVPDSVKTWWNERNSREHLLLLVMAIALMAAVIYKIVLEPIVGGYLQAESRYAAADKDYRWLQDQRALLSRARSQTGGILPVTRSAAELKKLVDESSKKEKIKMGVRVVQDGEAELLEVEFNGIVGNQLISWLEGLIRQGTRVIEIEASNNNNRLYGKFILGG